MEKLSVLIEAYIREKQEGKGTDFNAGSWLDSAAKLASQISVATHVLKYTHGDAKGTNLHVKAGTAQHDEPRRYVATDTLNKVKDDFVGNAAAMGVAGLLQLEIDGVTLLDLIAKDDSSALKPFATSHTQLSNWMSCFKSVLTNSELSSHTLAKQIYFPVESDQYHLLAPLFASSLAQELYVSVKEDRFGDKAKEARNCKKNALYSDVVLVDYPDLAIQRFGGTKPQNISRLNSSRGGVSYLLRSAPPIWNSIKKPPMKKNAFWRTFEKRSAFLLNEFKGYLVAIQNLASNIDIRNQRKKYVDQMLDLLIQTSGEIQVMDCGWSKNSEIPLHEQLWLDPFREDQDFQEKRTTESWKDSVARRFATWIIQKLKYKSNLQLGDVEHNELSGECLEILKAVER